MYSSSAAARRSPVQWSVPDRSGSKVRTPPAGDWPRNTESASHRKHQSNDDMKKLVSHYSCSTPSLYTKYRTLSACIVLCRLVVRVRTAQNNTLWSQCSMLCGVWSQCSMLCGVWSQCSMLCGVWSQCSMLCGVWSQCSMLCGVWSQCSMLCGVWSQCSMLCGV